MESRLDNGQALAKFRELIEAQGGNAGVIDDEDLLPKSGHQCFVKAPQDGYVESVDAMKIALASKSLSTLEDGSIDHSVGIVVQAKIGDKVEAGQIVATIHTDDLVSHEALVAAVADAFAFSVSPVNVPKLIHELFE